MNNPLFDIHTHRPDAPVNAFINIPMEVLAGDMPFTPSPENSYSAGIHPMFEGNWEKAFRQLKHISLEPHVKAIGECGLDRRSKTPISSQITYFQQQINLAVQQNKPLIIHCVHSWDVLMAICQPSTVPFIVHGFRGKPQLAQQLLRAGFALSFGSYFNPKSLKICPSDKYYIETDDNPHLTIQQVADLHALALRDESPKNEAFL